jgi:PEP-CTERM/exosortase A-associated glycosyltransferase
MRILHILDHSIPLHSGYSFRTLAILREQRALGWETYQITSPKQEVCASIEEDIDGWHFYRTIANGTASLVPGLGEIQLMHKLAGRIAEIAERVRPDVLHVHSPVLNAIPALWVGRQLKLPVVYEVRAFWEDAAVDHGSAKEWGPRYRLTRAMETFALKRAEAITTICEGLRSDIVTRGIPREQVTVIPNAVDIEHFSMDRPPDSTLKHRLGLVNARVLGFIGSFYAYEGLGVLIRALPVMLTADPGVRLLLVGGGPDEENLRTLVRQLGVEGKVRFAGRVPHGEVGRYYGIVDVLVYPRLSMRLTELVTPLKPLEAMAQGRSVVASDVGGHRELIVNGETGLLFKAGDPEDLARKGLALLSSPEHAAALRARAREFVERERNWKVSVARYQDVYGGIRGHLSRIQ